MIRLFRGRTHYSSAGQEQWVFNNLPLDSGYAIDAGANDGWFNSNTIAAEVRGWTVLCIEANSEYEDVLRKRRTLVEICAAGAASQDDAYFYVNPAAPMSESSLRYSDSKHFYNRHIINVRTLDQLLEKHAFPRLDLVSIDVEHTELDVLKGLDIGHWLPKAFIVESVADEDQQAIAAHLAPHGYRMVEHMEFDWIYVR